MTDIQPAMKYRRPILVIYYSIVALVVLGIVETGFRAIELFGPRTFTFRQYDDLLGVSLIPNVAGVHRYCFDGYVSINAQGLRDAPRQWQKPPGTLRIGLFGDSIAEGVHVYPDQVASRRLETRLNREFCNGKCEVLNFAVGGYGTLQEWLRYRRDGRPFGLDVAVLLFIGNDVQNNLPQGSFDQNLYLAPYLTLNADGSDELHPPTKPKFYEILFFLTKHSAAFRAAYKVYFHFFYLINQPTLIHHFDLRQGNRQPIDFNAPDSDSGRTGWAVTERILDKFVADVRKDGADFIIVHSGYEIPKPTPRDLELAAAYQKDTGWPVDFDFGAKWFARFSQQTGVPVFNWERYLDNYLTESNLKDVGLGYSCDAHFNPEGHTILGDFLYQSLVPVVRAKLPVEQPR